MDLAPDIGCPPDFARLAGLVEGLQIESAVRYLGADVEDAPELAEATKV